MKQRAAKEAVDELKRGAAPPDANPAAGSKRKSSGGAARGPDTAPRKAARTPPTLKSPIHVKLQAVNVQITRDPDSYGYRALFNAGRLFN